ncbi:hypothetical protein [Dactylosporangium sp. NPDC051541]|uniref:hypothetical protein n=1 Tax=Dactylosporangium sp. NPDC051541 TaxID=3363977 RepID=UPI0037A838FD
MTRHLARLVVLLLALATGGVAAAAPAVAAINDRIGFVLWGRGGVQFGSSYPPAWGPTTVTPGPPGEFEIVFPTEGLPGGVVHVTAINDTPHWCQATGWASVGVDEHVGIACFKVTAAGPVPDHTAFTAFFERSSGPVLALDPFGYVDALPTGAVIDQINTGGLTNTVTPVGVGHWVVRMPGMGTAGPLDGSVQVTAVSPAAHPVRCKPSRWASAGSGQVVDVVCFDGLSGALVDSRFAVTYQFRHALFGGVPSFKFGYLLQGPPLGPAATNFNSVTGGSGNISGSVVTGITTVRFPALGIDPDNVQVTAVGANPNFCALPAPWTHPALTTDTIATVNCYDPAGNKVSSGFTITAFSY